MLSFSSSDLRIFLHVSSPLTVNVSMHSAWLASYIQMITLPCFVIYHGCQSVMMLELEGIISSLSQTPASIRPLTCHKFTQVRWLLMPSIKQVIVNGHNYSKMDVYLLKCRHYIPVNDIHSTYFMSGCVPEHGHAHTLSNLNIQSYSYCLCSCPD